MALTPGSRLGVYEVTARIGQGGMGEVYQATDTSLKRAVAIKVLPAALAADADRLTRFQREAEVLASLNHPNIAGIYGLERSGPTTALVMELVEGEDLSQRIASGPIPIDEALAIAKQIAHAIEAAHEQGIIHRDLKPANVKVRPDGAVKVLDFGLAKAMDPAAPSAVGVSTSPAITTPAMTHAGAILGTAAYMAPEQARGKAVDKRADIWAFGVVLFEVLTGHRLFDGGEVSDTLALVLTKEPDWSRLPAATPPQIVRLLRRCLLKDRAKRLADIADARMEIDEALAAPASEASAVITPAALPRSVWTTAVPWTIAAAAHRAGVRAVLLADGRWIAFFADGLLKKVSSNGGAVVSLGKAPTPLGGWWAEDNTIVYGGIGHGLTRVSAEDGRATPVTTLGKDEAAHTWPQILPGGRGVLYAVPDIGNDPSRSAPHGAQTA